MPRKPKTTPDATETQGKAHCEGPAPIVCANFDEVQKLCDDKATEAPQPIEPPKAVPTGWSNDPVATMAANRAFLEGKTPEECFEAAKEAVDAMDEVDIEQAEADAALLNESLERDYYVSVCNLSRGVADLSKAEAQRTAATVGVPYVSFEVWKKRLGF